MKSKLGVLAVIVVTFFLAISYCGSQERTVKILQTSEADARARTNMKPTSTHQDSDNDILGLYPGAKPGTSTEPVTAKWLFHDYDTYYQGERVVVFCWLDKSRKRLHGRNFYIVLRERENVPVILDTDADKFFVMSEEQLDEWSYESALKETPWLKN